MIHMRILKYGVALLGCLFTLTACNIEKDATSTSADSTKEELVSISEMLESNEEAVYSYLKDYIKSLGYEMDRSYLTIQYEGAILKEACLRTYNLDNEFSCKFSYLYIALNVTSDDISHLKYPVSPSTSNTSHSTSCFGNKTHKDVAKAIMEINNIAQGDALAIAIQPNFNTGDIFISIDTKLNRLQYDIYGTKDMEPIAIAKGIKDGSIKAELKYESSFGNYYFDRQEEKSSFSFYKKSPRVMP